MTIAPQAARDGLLTDERTGAERMRQDHSCYQNQTWRPWPFHPTTITLIAMRTTAYFLLLVAELFLPATAVGAELQQGPWRAWLDSPGGELPFGLEFRRGPRSWRVWVVNGFERIKVPAIYTRDDGIVLDIDHYDATITAKLDETGTVLSGEWKKRGKAGRWARLVFHAEAGETSRFVSAATAATGHAPGPIDGRWSVRFSSSKDSAVGVFRTQPDGTILGTFLTSTGDYRFLAGRYEAGRLRLSCFDGAHAFLFDAHMQPDETLQGDFWSGDSWHETWTATRDSHASLGDGFARTRATGTVPLARLTFPGLDGKPRSLDDPLFRGKARILEIFGSWCPNCHDASIYLTELDRRYRVRGLSIVGLAFELTGNFDRDVRQVRRFVKRHRVTYPILLAGVADKEKASKALPFLDHLRAFPTTIFIDSHGKIRAIHTGFSGPATDQEYVQLRVRFEDVIKELLKTDQPAEPAP